MNHLNSPKVAIIILNWNGWEDTIECIESLYKINYSNYNTIIIDNYSEDDSIKKIKEYCKGEIEVKSKYFRYNPDNKPIGILELFENDLENLIGDNGSLSNKILTLISNQKNHGFTEGNNIGMRFAIKNLNPDYILLLNNDTIVDADFLDKLVKIAEKESKIGFVGPKIYFYEFNNKSNIIQYAGGKQNLWKFSPEPIGFKEEDVGQFNKNKEVEFIHGSCMLVKTEMINDIGLLDKEFFTFIEENDWCMRGNKRGWLSMYGYKSVIWHKGGKSTNSKKIKPLKWYYMTKNRFLFIKKHANSFQKVSFLIYFFLIDCWFWIGASILYFRSLRLLKSHLSAVKDGIILLIK